MYQTKTLRRKHSSRSRHCDEANKPPLGMVAPCTGTLSQVPDLVLPIQLNATEPGKKRIMVQKIEFQSLIVEDTETLPNSWFQLSPSPNAVAICEPAHGRSLSLPISFSVVLPFKYINLKRKLGTS